jgi:hypothetical protein
MNYTNKHNLPEYIVAWLLHDDYDYDDSAISTTTLLKPARAYVLGHLHKSELSIDVADLIALRYGSALHESFEVVLMGQIQEIRYFADIGGYRISGKPDLILDDEIHDFKSTSVWGFIYGSKDDDFIKQMSIYRLILHRNGIDLKDTGVIDFLFTDWSKSKAGSSPDYPALRYAQKRYSLMSLEETEAYIVSRLSVFEDAFDELPKCTAEELWSTETTYAVMKSGNIKAKKVCSTQAEADAFINGDPALSVEVRPGMAKRCAYCAAAPFCDQFKDMQAKGLVSE